MRPGALILVEHRREGFLALRQSSDLPKLSRLMTGSIARSASQNENQLSS
jgi:hypothetical protein